VVGEQAPVGVRGWAVGATGPAGVVEDVSDWSLSGEVLTNQNRRHQHQQRQGQANTTSSRNVFACP